MILCCFPDRSCPRQNHLNDDVSIQLVFRCWSEYDVDVLWLAKPQTSKVPKSATIHHSANTHNAHRIRLFSTNRRPTQPYQVPVSSDHPSPHPSTQHHPTSHHYPL